MPALASRIRAGTFFSFLSQAIRLATNLLLFVGIARMYGPDAFGRFTAAHTFATILILVADFGFDALVATEIARNPARRLEVVIQYFSLKVVFAIGASVAMLVLSQTMTLHPDGVILFRVFAPFIFFTSILNFFSAVFRGNEVFGLETRISFIANGVLLVAIVIASIFAVTITTISVVFVAARVVGVVLAYVTARKRGIFPQLRFTWNQSAAIWRKVLVFGLNFLFGSLFFQLDTLLLTIWRSDYDVGIYQSAFKIFALTFVIPEVLINSAMPVLSSLHGADSQKWISLGGLINKALLVIGVPMGLVLSLFADQIIPIVYGASIFNASIPVLQILGCVVVVRFVVESSALMLTTSDRQYVRMYVVAGATLFNFLLNAFLIPRYGSMGAAVTALLTNLLVGIAYVTFSRAYYRLWILDVRASATIILSIGLCVGLWSLKSIPIIVTLPAFFVVYAVLIFFVAFPHNQWRSLFARPVRAGL